MNKQLKIREMQVQNKGYNAFLMYFILNYPNKSELPKLFLR